MLHLCQLPLSSTAINVTTDLILCIVPIPLFWRLQLPKRQKIMISGLFFLGGLYVPYRPLRRCLVCR